MPFFLKEELKSTPSALLGCHGNKRDEIDMLFPRPFRQFELGGGCVCVCVCVHAQVRVLALKCKWCVLVFVPSAESLTQ